MNKQVLAMNKEQILSVIEQGLNAAATKGVFGLQDSNILFTALVHLKEILSNDNEIKEELKPEVKG